MSVTLGATKRQDDSLQSLQTDVATGEAPWYAAEDFDHPRSSCGCRAAEPRGIVRNPPGSASGMLAPMRRGTGTWRFLTDDRLPRAPHRRPLCLLYALRFPGPSETCAGKGSRNPNERGYDDGDLVIVSNAGKTLWSTGTAGHPGATARFGTDGNLVVVDTDGTTVLWESGTVAPGGRAVLQDRGNFVVHDASGASRWASGTAVRHDYDGDGRSDLGAWYDFAAGSDATYTFFGEEDGSISAPMKSWNAPTGAWEARYMKHVTGDFDGDGRGDIAALSGYSDTSLKVWVWLGQPDGGFGTPFATYSSPAGAFHISHMTPQAGDYDGDGRDDLAGFTHLADNGVTFWTWTARPDALFDGGRAGWTAPATNWVYGSTRLVGTHNS